MSIDPEREFVKLVEAVKHDLNFDEVVAAVVADRIVQNSDNQRLGYVEGRALIETVRQELNPEIIKLLRDRKLRQERF